jgi:hypothetical protein
VVDVGATWTLVVWLVIDAVWVGADAVRVSVTVLLCADSVTMLVFSTVVVLSGCVVDVGSLAVVLFVGLVVSASLLCPCDETVDAACCACWATVPDPPDPHALITDASTPAARSVAASLAPNL